MIARLLAALAISTLALGDVASAHDMSAHTGGAAAKLPDVPGLSNIGGPFALIDQDGRPRTDAEFRGKLMLVTFGYTNCPDICPLDLRKTADALALAGPAVAGRVAPLFITVDPKRDTPARLNEFIRSLSPDIIGLTGDAAAIASVARAYHVHVTTSTNGEPEHSGFQYLMAADGKLIALIPPAATAADIAARLTKAAPPPLG